MSQAAIGARLRYQISSLVAPYVGVDMSALSGTPPTIADRKAKTQQLEPAGGIMLWFYIRRFAASAANQKRNTIDDIASKSALIIALELGSLPAAVSSDDQMNPSAAGTTFRNRLLRNEIGNAGCRVERVQDAPRPLSKQLASPRTLRGRGCGGASACRVSGAQEHAKAAKPAPKPDTAAPEPAPKGSVCPTCTPEHRAMGHC